jgi:hypothetical protein
MHQNIINSPEYIQMQQDLRDKITAKKTGSQLKQPPTVIIKEQPKTLTSQTTETGKSASKKLTSRQQIEDINLRP